MARINKLLTDIERKINNIGDILENGKSSNNSNNNIKINLESLNTNENILEFINSERLKDMFSIIPDDSTKIEVFKFIQSNASQINTINNLKEFISSNLKKQPLSIFINNDQFQYKHLIISKQNILIILSYFFLMAITKNNIKESILNGYEHFNFLKLVKNIEKSKCLVNYFWSLYKLSIERHYDTYINQYIEIAKRFMITNFNFTKINNSNKLSHFNSTIKGIKNNSYENNNCYGAFFAHTNIGGNVLSDEFNKEEIRFLISPECLIAVLYFHNIPIKDNEVICINRINIFSNYSIINYTFKFENMEFGPANLCKIIAFDARDYSFLSSDEQYNIYNINREINKCISAFKSWFGRENYKIKTESLGCDKFKGDPQLKLIIQWIAASITSRYLDYNIDENLFSLVTYFGADDFQSIIQEIRNRYPTVSELYNACIRICNSENKHNIIIQLLS